MNNAILKNQLDSYRKRFLEFGDSPKGVFWNNTETQHLRFKALIEQFLLHSPSGNKHTLHEIGCGSASMLEYLKQENLQFEYSGTDIVEEMLQTCRRKFPDNEFHNRNILELNKEDVYDFVCLSGVLNLKNDIDIEDWREFAFSMIKKMYSISRAGISFNFLTSDITVPPDPTLNYFDPREMLLFCQENISRFIHLNQSYPLFEVTVTIFKPEFLAGKYDDKIYGKYFGKK